MYRLVFQVILIIIPVILMIFWFANINIYLKEWLLSQLEIFKILIVNYPTLAVISFILVYSSAITLSLPFGTFLTFLGGFLFGPIVGGAVCVVSASIGAMFIFLVIKAGFSSIFKKWADSSSLLKTVEIGLEKDVWRYLFFLRLFPLVPFWLANIAPALLGVRFFPFVLTTFLGVIPGTFIISWAGSSVNEIIQLRSYNQLSIAQNLPALISLISISFLIIAPVAVKYVIKWKK